MAAMAQQDCGQCGYDCHNYAQALFARKEQRAQSLRAGRQGNRAHVERRSREEFDSAVRRGCEPEGSRSAGLDREPSLASGVRARPLARQSGRGSFLSRRRLNKPASEKESWHIEFDLSDSGLDYAVGDSLGVLAQNDLGLVDQIIAMIGASPLAPVNGKTPARGLARRLLAVAGAGSSLRARLLSHRRRDPRQGARAGAGRRPGQGRRRSRRAGGADEISGRAAACGSLRRSAGALAAAALFHLLLAEDGAGQACRSPSTPCAT